MTLGSARQRQGLFFRAGGNRARGAFLRGLGSTELLFVMMRMVIMYMAARDLYFSAGLLIIFRGLFDMGWTCSFVKLRWVYLKGFRCDLIFRRIH